MKLILTSLLFYELLLKLKSLISSKNENSRLTRIFHHLHERLPRQERNLKANKEVNKNTFLPILTSA